MRRYSAIHLANSVKDLSSLSCSTGVFPDSDVVSAATVYCTGMLGLFFVLFYFVLIDELSGLRPRIWSK